MKKQMVWCRARQSLIPLLFCCAPVSPSLAQQPAQTARITGVVTDFNSNPIAGAEVKIKNEKFGEVAVASTDARGAYALTVDKGRYMALYACKDYTVKNLEFWSWNLIVDKDLVINPRIDGLEVYAMNAFPLQLEPSSMRIYFRPMSLKRFLKAGGKKKLKESTAEVIDIAPGLAASDIDAEINGARVRVLALERVKEYSTQKQGPKPQYIWSYLMQTSLPKDQAAKVWDICLMLKDAKTREQGEGCLTWEKPDYVRKGEGF